MPSSANAFASSSLDSGSSAGTSRSACWTIVTLAPKRENTCASSQPTGPPPSTTSDPGTSSTATASRLVQYGVSASPSTGGTAGSVPVLSTTPRRAVNTCSVPSGVATVTSRGAVSLPQPRTKVPPALSNRSTATRSSQLSVASSRMRRATGAQSCVTSAAPASTDTRRASPSASVARIIIFVGMHA